MATTAKIIPTTSSSSFPGCALSCTTLTYAQDICYPPNAAQSVQATYNNCFCASAFLSPLYSSPDVVCATECPIAADRSLLQAWYTTFCQQVAAGVDPVSASATASTTNAASTGTATGAVVTATNSASGATSSNDGKSWIDGHWKYVVMIIVIAVALVAFALFVVWLKKRHRRKVDSRRAAASGFPQVGEKRPDLGRSATPDLWGPHQMMQATQGYQYNTEGVLPGTAEVERKRSKSYRLSKQKEPDVDEIAELEGGSSSKPVKTRPSSRRQRPSELELNSRLIGAADRRHKGLRGTEEPRISDKEMEESLRGKRKIKRHKDVGIDDGDGKNEENV